MSLEKRYREREKGKREKGRRRKERKREKMKKVDSFLARAEIVIVVRSIDGFGVEKIRAPRSIEASASVESASKKRRSISLRKYRARQQKIVRAPKTAVRRFYNANI